MSYHYLKAINRMGDETASQVANSMSNRLKTVKQLFEAYLYTSLNSTLQEGHDQKSYSI